MSDEWTLIIVLFDAHPRLMCLHGHRVVAMTSKLELCMCRDVALMWAFTVCLNVQPVPLSALAIVILDSQVYYNFQVVHLPSKFVLCIFITIFHLISVLTISIS